MKSIFIRSFSFVLLAYVFGCNKHDKDDFSPYSPANGSCDVRQYNFALTPLPTPYLFRKTYDNSGVLVDSIDAYFWSTGLTPFHKPLKLAYKGENIFFIDANQDTAIILTLNNYGRPLKVLERPALYDNPENTVLYSYEYDFSYEHNRLLSIEENTLGFMGVPRFVAFIDTCRYDRYGNIISISDGSFTYDTYSYDYTKKAKQQFYLDMEEITIRIVSIELLEYLNFFPELTSPPNIRTKNIAGGGLNTIFNQHFDNMGKLIRYSLNDSSTINSIIWNCPR